MFRSLKDSSKVVLFTVIVILLAVLFSYIPGISVFVYMLTPTIAVLIMMLLVTRDGYTKTGWKLLGLHKLGRKAWLFAIFVPIIPFALSFAVVWLTGISSVEGKADFEGISWAVFPLAIVFIYVKAVLTQSMGEELGWRGYLLPLMLRSMGKKKAYMLNGLIHGVWHFPLMINTDSYHADDKLWLILPLTVLSTVALAPVIGEIRMRTGSVWTSSMIHTTHNLVWLVLGYFVVDNHEAAKYLSGDMSIIVVLFYLGLSLYMWKRNRSEKLLLQ
ncbi:type II CAAX endopeptidase family protein [Paenibacillus xylaniclasticus]|uniref:type II CAAX endopeptidase family protein n=1 Tax=Paenibacillus xylaniclasticus TaxID=588083 RepID=UPI000FDCAABE|nr:MULTISPECIES: type II CAAX endopeptidase family protein [Paenibacillus]GFN33912.1 hypothetical protein PCURB6_41720 [Paenibacillus curdlanolyticus]